MSEQKSHSVSDAYQAVNADQAQARARSGKSIFRDGSFWGMLTTQFLGAFNDNLYKQLMLLLAVPAVAAAATGQGEQSDVQGWATLVFSIPFVLFSGYAGFLSDRYSKTPIINLCKVAEVFVMLLGVLAFYFFDALGNWGTWFVLFLMGTQSSFFGPGKYGILPELFREEDLPRANSLMLMTTFLAIIFGTVLAGGLKDLLAGPDDSAKNLWIGMTICVGIAVVGTITSMFVRRVPPAQPQLKFTPDALGVSSSIYRYLGQDKTLLMALVVSSIFWLVSGIAVPTVNRLGRWLGVNDTMTSLLTASIGLGIMAGALVASQLCRRGWGDRCVTIGLLGMCGCLVLLGCWSGGTHVLGFGGSLAALLSLGVFAAIFAIPIQVFIQSRPPAALKGRMVATMNQANFIGILSSGPIYQVFESVAGQLGAPISSVFWMMAALVLPVGLIYRLDSSPLAEKDASAVDAIPSGNL
ncbi:MAG: MFS transporter [Aureliella sp.]